MDNDILNNLTPEQIAAILLISKKNDKDIGKLIDKK